MLFWLKTRLLAGEIYFLCNLFLLQTRVVKCGNTTLKFTVCPMQIVFGVEVALHISMSSVVLSVPV